MYNFYLKSPCIYFFTTDRADLQKSHSTWDAVLRPAGRNSWGKNRV